MSVFTLEKQPLSSAFFKKPQNPDKEEGCGVECGYAQHFNPNTNQTQKTSYPNPQGKNTQF